MVVVEAAAPACIFFPTRYTKLRARPLPSIRRSGVLQRPPTHGSFVQPPSVVPVRVVGAAVLAQEGYAAAALMGRIRTLLLLLAATADARSLGPAGAGASAVTSSASDRADRLASSTSSSTTSTAAAAAAASALHVPRSPQPPNGEPQPTQQPTQRPTQMALQENIQARYQSLCSGLDPHISPAELALKVCSGLPSASVSPAQLSELMAETAAAQSSLHPDFARARKELQT